MIAGDWAQSLKEGNIFTKTKMMQGSLPNREWKDTKRERAEREQHVQKLQGQMALQM